MSHLRIEAHCAPCSRRTSWGTSSSICFKFVHAIDLEAPYNRYSPHHPTIHQAKNLHGVQIVKFADCDHRFGACGPRPIGCQFQQVP